MPIPGSLQQLLRRAEQFFDFLNTNEKEMIRKSVFKLSERARACVRAGRGTLKGRRSYKLYM